MHHLYTDNAHMQLANEAKNWPLSDTSSSSSANATQFAFSADIKLGAKYVISSLLMFWFFGNYTQLYIQSTQSSSLMDNITFIHI